MNDEKKLNESRAGETNRPEQRPDSLDAGLAVAFGSEESVATGSCQISVLRLLGKNLDSAPRVFLRPSIAEGEDPVVRPGSSEVPETTPDSRYRLDGEIARGGMGVIIKGRDIDLGRDLAIKVMLDSHKDKSAVVQRFIEEAQVGGQLQHPGIVPVYDLGQFQDHRPFFTMKLVKGKTLPVLLSERESPSEDRTRFLVIFEQICQTMAYAHSRGVIHRDLKPANIMVGAFGEVQVMDWGLAKVLAAGGVADERKAQDEQQAKSAVQTIRSVDSDAVDAVGSQTQMGSVLGTPAYMAPEQAAGKVDSLDERADVFGLGAILCEILTGQPPYVSDDKAEALRLARHGDLENCFQRLATCGADEELVVLVRDCLAVTPHDRPRDAGIVRKRATSYRESVEQRLRQVQLDRIEADARADEERKRRKVVLALALSTLITFGVIGGGWLWVNQKAAALSQAQAEARLAALTQREQLARRISDELSTAQALRGDAQSGSLPDTQDLTRAFEAAQRAKSFLSTGYVSAKLAAQVTSLLTQLESQHLNQNLQAGLEEIWEWEMDRLAEQDAFERQNFFWSEPSSQTEGNTDRPEDHVTRSRMPMSAVAGAATRYEQAFAKWGLKPGQTTLAEAAQRVQSLHPTHQASVLVSLDRWQLQLGALRSLPDWERAEWSVLEPIKLTSRGRDLLEVQPDRSILASGEDPERGYELLLETEQQDIAAFRLEAMLDESLPNSGPGRGQAGAFAIDGLQIWCAPRSNVKSKRRLKFRSAIADATEDNFPLTPESWHVGVGEGGKARVAIFEVDQPVHSDSGFRLTISHRDRDAGYWGYEKRNLGRFRWSVSADRRDDLVARWLANVIDQADEDDWRQSMRSEIQRGDIAALIERAENLQAIRTQPEIILVQLANALRDTDDTDLLGMLSEAVKWEVLKPREQASDNGATLSLQEDGSILYRGWSSTSNTLVLTARSGNRPITAIRLEAMPDPELPSDGAELGAGMPVALAEFKADVCPASNPDQQMELVIERAIADFAVSPMYSVSKTLDGLSTTAWHILAGHRQKHTALFIVTPTQVDEDTILRLRLAPKPRSRGPIRFRLSVSYDPINLPDPKLAALRALRHIHQQHPDNYWVNLALAETLFQQTPPALDEAIPYATAALALRPDNAMPHATLVRALSTIQLDLEHPQGQLASFHARRVRDLDAENASLQYAAAQQAEIGFLLHRPGELEEAIAKYNFAIDLDPSNSIAHLWLGRALVGQGKLGEAIDTFRHSLVVDPHFFHAQYEISNVLLRQGKVDKAIDAAHKALEICPDSPGAYRSLCLALHAKGRLNEATDACRRGLDLLRYQGWMDSIADNLVAESEDHPTDPSIHFAVGVVMLENGKLDEAIDAFGKALEHDPDHGLSLYYLGNALRQQGKLDEAIRAYRKAIQIDATYAHAYRDLGVALMAKNDPQAARKMLQKSMDLFDDGDSRDWFWVAMSEWRLGNKQEARRWYARAVRWMEENDPENRRLVAARAEAQKTLGLTKGANESSD